MSVIIIWSPIFTLIRQRSGSVIGTSIFHGSINASIGFSIIFLSGGNELLVGGTGLAGIIVLGIINFLVYLYYKEFRYCYLKNIGGNIMEDKEKSFQELKEEEENKEKEKSDFETWNGEKFYYIAGYTSGGAPYGITLEENKNKNKKKKEENGFWDGDLPF